MTVAILFLAATTVLNGCKGLGQIAACGAPPTNSIGMTTWGYCVERYEKEKAAEEYRQGVGGGWSAEAEAKWIREVSEAKKEASSTSRKYPRLAWLNGMWCAPNEHRPSDGMRWEVIGRKRIRSVHHSVTPANLNRDFLGDAHYVEEKTFNIEEKNGYFELTERPDGALYELFRITKDSESQYTQLYGAALFVESHKVYREYESDSDPLRRCVDDDENDKQAPRVLTAQQSRDARKAQQALDARQAQQARDARRARKDREAQQAKENRELEKKLQAQKEIDISLEKERWPRSHAAALRWPLEVEEAVHETNLLSPEHPRIAWLNGVWCGPTYELHSNAFRWQVVAADRLRNVHYSKSPANDLMNIPEEHFLIETTYSVEEKDGYFEITEHPDLSVAPFRMHYIMKHIRMESDSTYSQLYAALVLIDTDEVDIELDPTPPIMERCIIP